MRIVLMGQAPFGAKTLEALLERGEEIVAVYVPPDRPGGRIDPLKALAEDKNIPVLQPGNYRSDDTFEEYKSFSPDLLIMAFVTDIIPARYFEYPAQGAICYHPSLLPRHRGASAINWAIIMGEEKTGLTIFWPDGGIDTGPILLQKEVEIKPTDTTGSIYFNHLFPMGIDAIVESVELIKQGRAPRIPQDEKLATYEPPCDDSVAQIDWSKPGPDIYNLIRGCDPQPGAYSYLKDQKIRFYGCSYRPAEAVAEAGKVVEASPDTLKVSTGDGILEISKVRVADLGKVKVGEFVEKHGIKAGDRFKPGK